MYPNEHPVKFNYLDPWIQLPEIQAIDNQMSELKVTDDEQVLASLISMVKEFVKQVAADVRRMCPSSNPPVTGKEPSLPGVHAVVGGGGGDDDGDEVIDADPISYHVPDDYDHTNIPLNFGKLSLAVKPNQTKKRERTDLRASVFRSFNLPQEFINHAMNLQKANKLGDMKEQTFSFADRLQGWLVERKQRFNGRFDTYYIHLKSNVSFRSTAEVTNFILYESYPNMLRSGEGSSSSTRKCRKRRTPKFAGKPEGLLVPEEIRKDLESIFPDSEMANNNNEEIDPLKLEEEMDLINHIETCEIDEVQRMFSRCS